MATEYGKAKGEWAKQVAEIIEDDKISPDELHRLRGSAEKFYREFGIQFE